MSPRMILTIDGAQLEAKPGQTILQAADDGGIYIPRLCAHKALEPFGACRVCTVRVDGRPQAACTTPAANGMIVENETEPLRDLRRALLEMLFVEGNHFCMYCERSGSCELQAMAYRHGILVPRFPYQFPRREVDASHPDILLDRNRCILCGRCVQASGDLDGKQVFQFTGRSKGKMIWVNAEAKLADTDLTLADKAVELCPVGALLKKRTGYRVPIGQRPFDHAPIGSDIEAKRAAARSL